MNYAKYCLEASRTKDFGKHKKVQPPTLCMQDDPGGDNASSMSDGSTSIASWRRSWAYRDVEKRQQLEPPCWRQRLRQNEPQRAWWTLVPSATNSISYHLRTRGHAMLCEGKLAG